MGLIWVRFLVDPCFLAKIADIWVRFVFLAIEGIRRRQGDSGQAEGTEKW
jgi:hypothetical protein